MTTTNETACQRAARYRLAREQIILGEREVEIERVEANGVRDRVKYGAADMDALNGLIADAEAACDIEEGRPPKRRRRLLYTRS